MRPNIALLFAALMLSTPVFAVQKCTIGGKITYQDAPCPGEGVAIKTIETKETKARAEEERLRKVSENLQRERDERARDAKKRVEDEEARIKAMRQQQEADRQSKLKALGIKCGAEMPEYPQIGASESAMLLCSEVGVRVSPKAVNETTTANGVARQYVYEWPSHGARTYIYTRNGVVTAIQKPAN